MERIQDTFLKFLQSRVSLQDKTVLEIGCGTGRITDLLARECKLLVATDPHPGNIQIARRVLNNRACLFRGSAEDLSELTFTEFDIVLFTLSFHHVPAVFRKKAIDEAVRVCRKEGTIIFLEPALDGPFFEAEAHFDACDGDEREAKRSASNDILRHSKIRIEGKIPDLTVFKFSDVHDFVTSMNPTKNTHEIHDFLRKYNFTLKAPRVIFITRPVK
jgi:ubiquinone/menaquinone biosynthesis C-methylase UbiE